MANDLYTDTPLSKAIFEMFENLSTKLEEYHKNKDLSPGSVKFYIFGGCAVHIYTNVRGSADVDAEAEGAELLEASDIIIEEVNFIGEDGLPERIVYDENFNVSIGSVHPDFKERAVNITRSPDDIAQIFLASPIDVAVSKLSRCASDDIGDIKSLYNLGKFDLEDFEALALEAKEYYAIAPEKLQSNIEYAIMCLSGE